MNVCSEIFWSNRSLTTNHHLAYTYCSIRINRLSIDSYPLTYHSHTHTHSTTIHILTPTHLPITYSHPLNYQSHTHTH